MSRVGRNDICPCGSGKKYKKCCLALLEAATTLPVTWPNADKAAACHRADEKLGDDLVRRVRQHDDDWFHDAVVHYLGDKKPSPADLQLFAPWSLYHLQVRGGTAADWFAEHHGSRLPPERLAWLEAQRAAWVGIWEAVEHRPGAGILLRDLFTREERLVCDWVDVAAPEEGTALLARLVDHEEMTLICGAEGRVLPAIAARELVESFLAENGAASEVFTPATLRQEATTVKLLRAWREATRARQEEAAESAAAS